MKKMLLVLAAVFGLSLVWVQPASAQFIPAEFDVEFDCDLEAGEHVITLLLAPPELGGTTVTVIDVTAEASPDTPLAITGFVPNPILAGEVGVATIRLTGSFTGNVDFEVTYQEAAEEEIAVGNVEFGEQCLPPTTTTTATTTTTTTPSVSVQPRFTG